MVVKSKGIPLATLLLILFLSAIFPTSFSNQVLNSKKPIPSSSASSLGSSVAFQIKGNVYPLGYYTVSLAIGNPPKVYDLDIDTGSDLTWVQCDAPCKGCTLPRNRLYKPHGDLVKCVDPLCAAIQSAPNHHCAGPNEQCDYEVEYADQGSSLGVLLRDNIPLKFTNGSLARPMLAFGCGYDQTHHGQNPPPSTAGVLGLGNGRTSILSQLHSLGLIRNVVGHCLSGRGGGFLFFGDQLIPPSGVVWTPLLQSSSAQHYKTGPADLFFDRKTTSVKGLELIFDSGSSYTYFNSQAHKALVNLIANDLRGKPLSRATGDPSLPICWKGPKPFKSLHDVTSNFKPLLLSFTKSKNSPLQLPPEAYLIVTKHGNVCLGILDGTEIGLGNTNIIGDISLQDKLVIYDNEKQQIGWASANCDRSSKLSIGLSQQEILANWCPATYMDVKNSGRGIPFMTFYLFLLLLSAISVLSHASSIAFQIKGNVYPLGYYSVNLAIGNPPKAYELDIDTGSDLTWVQCDAPCKGCTLPRDRQYKPHGNLVKCVDPLCAAIQSAPNPPCVNPNEQCDYEVEYADQGSSLGVLVRDIIPLKLTNGTLTHSMLAFGCGYDQTHVGHNPPPSAAGVLGLGNGRASILSQLNSKGLIRNVVGHCLSGTGGGFLFFGDQLIPQSGVVWTPILQSSSSLLKHYKTGPADMFFNGKATSVKGLELTFDSGSSYTYFNSLAHKALVDLITNDIKGKPLSRATEDPSLPICWKGPKPFKSLHDVTSNFKPLVLSFTKSKNSLFQVPPEAYLIVTKHGNVCLGILDGTEIGLGNTNIIGDISLQDKLVIYDNEKQRIGWASANCDRSSLMQGMLDITNDIKGKSFSRATEDPSLPICWKNPKTFKSLHDVTNYFKPIALSFTKSKNSLLQLPPEAYLIKYGNVCLGILDGTEIGLGNTNIIGDISLQDKMVIYDNEKQLCQL
ncbi:Aspartic proteinase Asp1 [Glycine max]|nr:Aspartic proteinase Asp1 [Glycine max]